MQQLIQSLQEEKRALNERLREANLKKIELATENLL